MVRDLMAASGTRFQALDRIAVTVGPGSFTGLRVGLAFGKGLALALGRSCVGVGTLEALAASLAPAGWRAAIIDAGRGRAYLQVFEAAQPVTAPDIIAVETVAARLLEVCGAAAITLVGPGVGALAGLLPRCDAVEMTAPSPLAVAALGARASLVPPRPLYMRAPDARPKTA